MKIKCIDNKNVEGSLKSGLEYEPVRETEKHYIIQVGKGIKATYLKTRFERVEE